MQWILGLAGWQLALIATAFTYLMTAAGAMLVLFCKNVGNTAFCLMTSGAAGIMTASTFFSLLLPAMESAGEWGFITLTCGFVAGGALIIVTGLVLNKLEAFKKDKKIMGTAVMCIAVTMHNIPEGLAVGVAFGALAPCAALSAGAELSANAALSSGAGAALVSAAMLALGIGIQNFPEGMCVAFPLRASGMGRGKSFFYGQLSGAVEIAAGVLGALAVAVVSEILPFALSFSAGAMFAVVCSELVPESFSNGKIKATIGVTLGFALMMILDLAFS